MWPVEPIPIPSGVFLERVGFLFLFLFLARSQAEGCGRPCMQVASIQTWMRRLARSCPQDFDQGLRLVTQAWKLEVPRLLRRLKRGAMVPLMLRSLVRS